MIHNPDLSSFQTTRNGVYDPGQYVAYLKVQRSFDDDDEGETTKVALEIKFKRITVLPPIGKQKRYPSLDMTVIHASERGAPKGR